MSDPVTLRQAVYAYLETMPGGYEIVWANTSGAGTPRIEVEPVGQNNRVILLGGTQIHDAIFQLTVVVALGDGETTSGPIVQAIMSHMANQTVIGEAKIMTTPREIPGYKDESVLHGEYRIPIEIRYRAYI